MSWTDHQIARQRKAADTKARMAAKLHVRETEAHHARTARQALEAEEAWIANGARRAPARPVVARTHRATVESRPAPAGSMGRAHRAPAEARPAPKTALGRLARRLGARMAVQTLGTPESLRDCQIYRNAEGKLVIKRPRQG